MGSDFSTLGLSHNIDEIEQEIQSRTEPIPRQLIEANNWSSWGVSGDLNVTSDGSKAVKSSDGKLCSVKGKRYYEFGVHFFALKWNKNKSSDQFTIGAGTEHIQQETDNELLLGENDKCMGWNPIQKTIHYNGCLIKIYPDKKYCNYVVPDHVTMVLNMDQGSISFRTDGEDFGTAMSGLKHVSKKLCIAACLKNKNESIEIQYLGGTDTLEVPKTIETHSTISTEPLRFHKKCGKNIILEDNNTLAKRNKPKRYYNGATVMTNRPLNNDEEFKIQIKEMDTCGTWSGSIIIGLTTANPEEVNYPPDSLVEYTNGQTWAVRENKLKYNKSDMYLLSEDIDELKAGGIVSIQKSDTILNMTIGNTSENIQINRLSNLKLHGFVDVYGQATVVQLLQGKNASNSTAATLTKLSSQMKSLNQFFNLLKERKSDDIEVVSSVFETYYKKVPRNRNNLRHAGDELSTEDRPGIITRYIQFLSSHIQIKRDEATFFSLRVLLIFVKLYTSGSMLFCKTLGDAGLLEIALDMLDENTVICQDVEMTESLLNILYYCSQSIENKSHFKKTKYFNVTPKFLAKTGSSDKICTLVLFTISFITSKEQQHLLKLPSKIVTYITECLAGCLNSKSKTYQGWHVRELVLAITNLTVNKDNVLAFVENNMVAILMKVLNLQDVYDQECGLNAIWDLITEETKPAVQKTENLIERLEIMAESDYLSIVQGVRRILAKIKVDGHEARDGSQNCKYMSLCRRFKESLNLADAYLASQYDICYCSKCHADRGVVSYYDRGIPSKSFGVPVGWCRFGLRTPPKAEALKVFDSWHRAFHGTRIESVEKILQVGELAPAGRAVLGGNTVKELPIHYSEEGFKPDDFNTKRIFLSPSIRYSGIDAYAVPSRFTDPLTGKNHISKVAFLVLVNPGSYQVGAETIGAEDDEIDPGFSNQEMEWIVEEQGSTVIYGLLVKIDYH